MKTAKWNGNTSIGDETLIDMYKWMVRGRIFDERALKYQRQGKIGTYAPLAGQEAAQVGSAMALTSEDWMFPSYREEAACMVRGVSMENFFRYTMGHLEGGNLKGSNVFPIQIIIGAQSLHAVGSAFADQYKNRDGISVAYVGDGATSEGDFHEALNFAGVFNLPVIFFVQNNQWAISMPFHKKTNSRSIAQKALAYGITGIQVDGNDAPAVYETMKEARTKAIEGTPVLIEAVTYRKGPHTTADDPTKYRQAEEGREWENKDPLRRMRNMLIDKNIWNETKEKSLRAELEDEVTKNLQKAAQHKPSTLEDALECVYDQPTKRLKEQIDEVTGKRREQTWQF
ncbi:pyruvate dehydrogenase (acetyl-transferring) E1 component subunit alpha [Alteribacillus sp. JSM 102045]|uniref:pyruvate dehydrogenase (acetyl-transferring) E1 component subunit alpha n=1 Tax=Alteribacillus sp. JSM 102045 TaxID=1562101 RepID=UPI0035C1DC6D